MTVSQRLRRAAGILGLTASLGALAVTIAVVSPSSADAFWTSTTSATSSGAASTATLERGATPSATVENRNSITVTWTATGMGNGVNATGYTVSRFDSSNTAQTVLAGCSGIVTALTCTETAVPDGVWTYRITPHYREWRGDASDASPAVRVDTVAPVNAITLTETTGGASKTGDTIFYRGAIAGSIRLSNAVSDPGGSGPASSSTGMLTGDTAGWNHTPSSVASPANGPYVSNVISWAAGTTTAPTLGVAGIDVAGNTAPTTLTMQRDDTAPTGGAISYPNGGTNASTVSVSVAAITDTGSGVAGGNRLLQRRTATLSGTTCGTFTGYTTIASDISSSASVRSVPLTAGQCSQYQYVFSDAVGNTRTSSSTSVVKAKSYASAVTSTPGLVSYFRLGETGWQTTDSVGSSSGSQSGMTTGAGAIAGDPGLSKYYDGVDDVNTVPRMISGNFTIEFWFRSTQSFGTSGGQWYQGAGLVDAEVSGTANDFGVSLVAGRVVAGTGNPDRSVSSSAAYNDGQWHHVVMTRAQGGVITLYVDGTSQGTIATNDNALTSAASLTFGRLQTGINYYQGYLDEVSLYNRVLTASEVTAHHQSGTAN